MSFLYKVFILLIVVTGLYFTVLNPVQARSNLGGDFSLTDHNNRQFQLQLLRGNVVLLFFGYTSCPDVCPMELGRIAQVLSSFEKEKDNVKALFISVDPDRDSPEKLKDYTAFFSKKLLGLTGSREQIDEVTRLYHASYRVFQDKQNRTVVDHSSNLYVIDTTGKLKTIVPYGLDAEHIVKVVEQLLEQQEVAYVSD